MEIVKHQQWHIFILLLLLFGLFKVTGSHSTFLDGSFLSVSTSTWFILAIAVPIIHQFYVLICWRLELFHQTLSRTLGARAFTYYKVGFALLILSRLVSIIILAISSAHSLDIMPPFSYTAAFLLAMPSIYLFYSVKKYFTMDRAFGIDHFEPEKYKNTTFVKRGIFKYSSNAMYVYGFLILWIPGLVFLSKTALLVAAFNHIYIWVHYYFTELPDIKVIYESSKVVESSPEM